MGKNFFKRFLVSDPNKKNQEIKLVSLIFAFGAFLRLFNLGQRQLWVDEIIQVQCFVYPSFRENLIAIIDIVAATPLDFMVQHFFVTLLGQSEFGVRFHAALFGILSLLIFYWIIKKFCSTQVALIGMFLFAVYPLHHQYSQEGRNYSLFCFLALSCYYLLCRALESKRFSWWFLYTLTTILLLYTNYFGGVLLISQAAFLIALKFGIVNRSLRVPLYRKWGPTFCLFLLCAGVASLVFFPWLLATLHRTTWDSPNIFLETGLFFRVFKEISGGGYPLSIVLLSLFVIGVGQLVRRQRWAAVALLVAWFIFPFPIILFLDWSRQYFLPIRQLLFTTPAMFLGVAIGIEGLSGLFRSARRSQKIQVMILVLIFMLSLGSIYRHAGREHADWKGLAEGVAKIVRDNDQVSAPNIDNVLSYYYPEIGQHNLLVQELMNESVFALNEQNSSIYLIKSIYMTANQKKTVKQVLAKYDSRSVAQFKGFHIYDISLQKTK